MNVPVSDMTATWSRGLRALGAIVGLAVVASCAAPSTTSTGLMSSIAPTMAMSPLSVTPPSPDPRVGLDAGLFDAEEAVWNLRVVSKSPPPDPFVGRTNSDLAFKDNYAIQGNYDGVQIWDVTDPTTPTTVITYVCPASQSDVSVYGDLLFVSGEGMTGRLDCGAGGVEASVSQERLRGIRIFDITDIRNPRYIHNVQTCRGSHTHTVLEDPNDRDNVYIYVSGSAPVRPADELPGCSGLFPDEDPNSALFRIEVIRVPLADPTSAAIVSSPRIFEDLVAPPTHGLAPDDRAAVDAAVARGEFVADIMGQTVVLPPQFTAPLLDSIAGARGGTGVTAADSAALREYLPTLLERMIGGGDGREEMGPTQCHDITVYPAIGLAGGACEGYGLLLDISNPVDPVRLAAVADSNFSYWHSATFNNDGSAILFTDEWGGGGAPKCRASDPYEWGANAIFTIEGEDMEFQSYYKMPAAQTTLENCVAHNGSLIPVPGRTIMAQSWYQGGISLLDWTDPTNPVEIAFHDRGPSNAERMGSGGSWSVYWYNGYLYSSEISRGLDVFELVASPVMTQNEIDASNTVRFDQLNSQGQPEIVWPNTFALAKAYLDQLERHRSVSGSWASEVRAALSGAEQASGSARASSLNALASQIGDGADQSRDPAKVRMLADVVRGLATGE
ncbi:MAG: hypothetical protein ACPHQP_05180 [Longimicrobiales bacterium]